MEIDKKTIPTSVNIVLDNNPEYIKLLKNQADEDGQNEDGENKISLTNDKHVFQMEEYYFDENGNEIYISGEMTSDKGKSYVFISIPLSDTVLIYLIFS